MWCCKKAVVLALTLLSPCLAYAQPLSPPRASSSGASLTQMQPTDWDAGTAVDFVFVIDVSGSMVGEPAGSGNAVIFPRVRTAVANMIEQVQPGSTVTLLPFADGVRPERRFEIETPADRQAAIQFLNSLTADGRNTYVYQAVDAAFRRYNEFRGRRTDRVAIMLVYTDGRDNGPERRTMQEVVRQFGLLRQQDDWLYYVTLGVELSEAERRPLEESGYSSYVPSPRGEVPDLWIVRPRYPLLAFGNLKRDPTQERMLSFAVSGTGPFPADGELRAEAGFDTLAEQGVNVEMLPGRFRPAARVPLRLELVNAQGITNGQYEGVLRLSSNNRNVLIRPNRVRVRFTYAPPRTVQLSAPPNAPRPDRVVLQELRPKHTRSHRDTSSVPFTMTLNEEVARSGGTFTARVVQDPGNAPLPTSAFRLNGERSDFDTVDVRRVRALSFGVSLQELDVAPGTYTGKLVLADGSAEVLGTREFSWRVEVARKPTPWWMIALALLALAGAVGWIWHLRRPVLRGRLIVRAPAVERSREIVLSGRREVRLDDAAQLVASEASRLRIVAEGVGRSSRPRVFKLVGDVYVRRSGEGFDDAIQNAVLADGDELVWNDYRLTYSKS